MNARDELLRANVYRAFAARGTSSFDDACRAVHDGWMLWPLIEYRHAFEQARAADEQRRAEITRFREDALQLLRETSHLCAAVHAQGWAAA